MKVLLFGKEVKNIELIPPSTPFNVIIDDIDIVCTLGIDKKGKNQIKSKTVVSGVEINFFMSRFLLSKVDDEILNDTLKNIVMTFYNSFMAKNTPSNLLK